MKVFTKSLTNRCRLLGDQRGIAHVVPMLVVVALFVGVGTYLVSRSNAAPIAKSSAPKCQGAWDTERWGKAWVCVVYTSKLHAYRVYGQVVDTKNDGFCVLLDAMRRNASSREITACTTNKIYNYDFSIPQATANNGAEFRFIEMDQYDPKSRGWGAMRVLWDNPYI